MLTYLQLLVDIPALEKGLKIPLLPILVGGCGWSSWNVSSDGVLTFKIHLWDISFVYPWTCWCVPGQLRSLHRCKQPMVTTRRWIFPCLVRPKTLNFDKGKERNEWVILTPVEKELESLPDVHVDVKPPSCKRRIAERHINFAMRSVFRLKNEITILLPVKGDVGFHTNVHAVTGILLSCLKGYLRLLGIVYANKVCFRCKKRMK